MHQTLKSAPQKTDHRPINVDNCFEEDTDDEHRISNAPGLVCLGECLEYLSLLGQFSSELNHALANCISLLN